VKDLEEDIKLSLIDETLGEDQPICARELKIGYLYKAKKVY